MSSEQQCRSYVHSQGPRRFGYFEYDVTTSLTTFAVLQKGMRARVVQASDSTPEAVRLQEMGLTAGTEFSVTKIAPLGDPIEIELRGYRLCLRRSETEGFAIVVLE